MKKLIQLAIALLVIPASGWAGSKHAKGAQGAQGAGAVSFDMLVSAGGAVCAPYGRASVTITPAGQVEYMDVRVSGLPPNTDFNFFVIQLPTAPFGMSWYQGDIETDAYGQGSQTFVGRFNIETFVVAPNSGPAPLVFTDGPFPDADHNPATNPLQMYHLGLWFDSPDAAAAAGCAGTVTPFSGNHQAGIQVLNTRNYPDDAGPLSQLQ